MSLEMLVEESPNEIDNEQDMVSLRVNKIDSVSPLRTGLALSPRKKPLRSKSTGSLGSHASGWDAKGKQSWIHDNFFQRNCFKFVANPKKTSGDICCCGRSLSNHDDPITNHNTVSWTPDSCTKKIPTKAFGEIQFVGSANQSARAPYVRLAEDTNVQLVMKLIKKVWKLEVPNLVISVTGGAKSFHLKPRLKEVFQRGLIKAAKSTGAWIITGGTNTGVMKHVGEAVRHMKVVGGASSDINVIGVATWGIVDRSADLTSESGVGYHPARYHTTPEEASKAPLDSSHTHFILVDNGTVGQYGVEIDLRSKIEEAISKEHTESRSSTGSIEVPVVMLVLEGGPGTVKTMTEAIKKKIPAVVIDGSGRAADVVAFAYKHTIPNTKNGKTVHVIDPAYKESVEAKVVEVFGERSLKNVYSMIEDVLEDEKMVTIYRLDEGGNTSRDIDLAILKALLKASRSSPLAQLNLALAWNRVDVAESDIFTENTRFKSDDLHNPMLTALLDDKADFVRLFLENGLSMREFLTVERLCVLYRSVSNSGILGSLIRHQMKKRGTKYITPQLIGYAIEELMGDSYHSYYLNNVRYFSEPQRNSSQFLRIRPPSPGTFVDATDNAEGNHTLPFSFLDVFTWAILSGKKELAKVLWEKGTYAIATALFATKLLKEMVEHSQDDHQVVDSNEELMGLANEYESLAVGMLDTCYMNDEEIAQSLIVRPLKPFGWLTCMDIAWLAKDQDFIAHSSCQILFNRLWMGGILMDTPWWKVLLCVLFPFLIYPMIYFVVDEYEDTKENFQNQEDLNMNTDEQKDVLEAADNNAVITNYRQFNNSMEMSELKDGNTKEQQVPQVTQQPRRNLLSEGEDDAVDNILRVSEVNCFQRVLRFYEAPFTKFVTNVCSYVAFLLMFCIVMLMNFEKYNVSVMEYILMGWVGVLMLEEIRQMLSQHPKHMYEKINLYLADAWNFVDILSLLAFAVASVLRFFPDDFDGDLFEAARIIYILDIILFIVRSLQMFAVSRQLGPKLVMIKTMLEDLKQFVIILAVFIVSYGVALQATLYPNTTNFWEVLKGIIQKPYFQMYGELFYEDFTEDPNIHDDGRWLGPALLGVYMLLTNVLLLNLLIAIFNYTFEKIQEGSDRVWKFQRYDLIREYHDRPTLAPPMMIISHVFVFIKWIVQMCGCGPKAARGSALKLNLDERENDQLSSWENHSRDMGLLKRKADEEEQMEQKVKNIDSKIDELSNQVERMMELSCDPSSIADSGNKNDKSRVRGLRSAHQSRNFEASISARVDSLEDRLIETSHTLEKILEIVSSSAFGKSDGRTEFSAGRKSIHIKARKSPYPLSTIMRISFPDTLVPWETPFPTYNPPTYTSPSVAKSPPWADVDVMSLHSRPVLKFNEFDNECNVNRRSYSGPYKIVDGLPFNPMGRTGITGRGLLGRFGPNHAADPIVTRWKMTSSGALIENGKKVLEFVAIQRKDNQEWAIPGGMVEPGQQISKTLKKEFIEEALAGLDMEDEEREELKVQVDELFQKGIEVFKGYVDDPRNTDVAWVETLAMNYHDDSGEIFNKIKLQAGDDAAAVRWQRVSGNIPLYANHVAMLENVANLHNANF